MKPRHVVLSIAGLLLAAGGALALYGAPVTSHAVVDATQGTPSGSAAMEQVMDRPGPITIESIASADWSVPLSGLLDLKRPAAVAAGLKDRDEPIKVYVHVLRHPKYGIFLVDTGISRKVVDDPGAAGVGWMVREVMHTEKLKVNKSTAEILQGLHGKLSGVFFTHLHIDHIAGMPDIPDDVPLYAAWPEATARRFKNLFVEGTSDRLLAGKRPLQQWHFRPDPQGRFEGVIDVFGDASLFAISVPGHTAGSVAYVVRTPNGPVLLTGDTSHTRWGWEHGVEPGYFTEDNARNLDNLLRLKALVARHPGIDVRLGHQP
jgi:N-acyl homoserine lactone hydrolase